MSWKSQGSAERISQSSSLTLNNLVTDTFILKNQYKGQWDIDGGLNVKYESLLEGNLYVNKNATIVGNVDISGSMNVADTNIYGDILVAENAYVRKNIYMDLSGGTTLHGENRKFGFNMVNPSSTIDISGDLLRTIDIHSSLEANKNVVARNYQDKGLTMNIDGSGAYIDFYVDNSINSLENYNARLLCEPGGKFTIDVTNTMQFNPHIIFSEVATDGIIADERIVIYDNADTDVQYMKDIYDASYLKTGTALFMVAGDNSSNVFFRTSTREGRGLTLGGGFFPNNRINGVVSLIDTSNVKYPALNIVSGKTANGAIIPKNLRTSIGVNKYDVYQNGAGENVYAMDINGPLRLGHQEIIVAGDISFEIIEMAFYQSVGIAIGSPIKVGDGSYTQYFLKTIDGGYTWTARRILSSSTGQPFDGGLESGSQLFRSVSISSSLNYLIGGTGRYLFYTTNGGDTWTNLTVSAAGGNAFDIESLYLDIDIFILGFTISNVGYIVHQNLDSIGNEILIGNGISDLNGIDINGGNTYYDVGLSSVNAIWGSYSNIFIVGNNGLRTANILGSDPTFGAITGSTALYGVHGYYTGGTNHVVAVGTNVIRYSHNGGTTWSSVAINGTLRSVAVVNSLCAIAVGDAGLVLYSIDGYATWSVVSPQMLNAMGNGGIISSVNLTNIVPIGVDKFSISGTIATYVSGSQIGRTKMYHLYAPYLFNRAGLNVLEASGNMVVSGDIWIRESGSLRTNNNTFYLLPDGTSDIYVGSTGYGNTSVRNRFVVAGTSQVADLSAQSVDMTGSLRVNNINTLNSENMYIGASTNIVNVGNADGEVRILGNLFLPGSITSTTVNNVEIKKKTILLNDESPYSMGSAFTGLLVRDNGDDNAGFILTNGTRSGYIFKTASNSNRVNLDVAGLTLTGPSTRGLLTLKPNLIMDISADYTISTDTIQVTDISMLDVSLNRRVLRNTTLTTATTQVVDTKLASSVGFYAGKLEADFIANSALDINGNAFATRLGLGTNGANMEYKLDISGSGYVSKNMDVSGNISVENNIFSYGTIYQW
jgi:photosystem II stability/assembly factor-like uncharacterized protein